MIGTVYGFENRETVRKKNYGFGYGFKTVQNRIGKKKLRFCLWLQNRRRQEKNLRFQTVNLRF